MSKHPQSCPFYHIEGKKTQSSSKKGGRVFSFFGSLFIYIFFIILSLSLSTTLKSCLKQLYQVQGCGLIMVRKPVTVGLLSYLATTTVLVSVSYQADADCHPLQYPLHSTPPPPPPRLLTSHFVCRVPNLSLCIHCSF